MERRQEQGEMNTDPLDELEEVYNEV